MVFCSPVASRRLLGSPAGHVLLQLASCRAMRPSVLQEDTAERERAKRERRQKLKQKARDKKRTSRERAAAEREASERDARSQQEATAKQRDKEVAAERWACLSVPAGPCVVQCCGQA